MTVHFLPKPLRAFTLVELIITAALFTLVVGLVGQLTVSAFRRSESASHNYYHWQQSANAADVLARELRHCQALLWPKMPAQKWHQGQQFALLPRQNFYLVFSKAEPSASPSYWTAFVYDGAASELWRWQWSSQVPLTNENLRSQSGVVSKHRLASQIENFIFVCQNRPEERCCVASVSWRVRTLTSTHIQKSSATQVGWPIMTAVRLKGV